ncbi:CRAL-TRIO lipid binding domain, GOLD domain-containing protein [Artemisia annua]|uniref:CRAL-TRIO lipid binding domain, GOLD domain-containing protein n=1 Tax=Artemisia annua TaxID=35608 RepID=A0A2U1QDM7_ARTAN|nr:CRAL-TRIO lipid binding domain, GOLD domain-containing protein [Artemisia annua]
MTDTTTTTTTTSPPLPTTTTLADVIEHPENPTKTLSSIPSFQQETTQLTQTQKNQLEELKTLIQQDPNKPTSQITIYNIPMFQNDQTDIILLKFLQARDFKVQEAFTMFKDTLQWRESFKIESLMNDETFDDVSTDFEKVVFNHGFDKQGHPVCYNVYGEFDDKDLYKKTFSDGEKRLRFLRWRIQFLEKSVRKLDFEHGGVNSIFQISDLKNSPGPAKRELRLATQQALQLLQDNYPEFVAKQVFINVPWWYMAFYTMISPFMTQRTKSKFVFATPGKTPETLFKYVSPEHVPIQYGGLSVDFCDCNPEFTINDPASVVTVKPATKQTVEIIVNEKCLFVWELRVVGWEVSYGAEYVPNNEDHYTIIIQKAKKMTPTDEPVISHNFKISELGKILLTIDNPTSKKKTLLYRFKVCPLSE